MTISEMYQTAKSLQENKNIIVHDLLNNDIALRSLILNTVRGQLNMGQDGDGGDISQGGSTSYSPRTIHEFKGKNISNGSTPMIRTIDGKVFKSFTYDNLDKNIGSHYTAMDSGELFSMMFINVSNSVNELEYKIDSKSQHKRYFSNINLFGVQNKFIPKIRELGTNKFVMMVRDKLFK